MVSWLRSKLGTQEINTEVPQTTCVTVMGYMGPLEPC